MNNQTIECEYNIKFEIDNINDNEKLTEQLCELLKDNIKGFNLIKLKGIYLIGKNE